ncbi:MAG: cytochrome c biogenesis protein CcdA [Candidatus Methanomethyliales bacterium]|nr:cytochrome c biogenesis protein CcdA [Candidatus Methanomethylicales archaeon]
MGLTAGFCPVNLAMVTPYMPSLVGSRGKVSSAVFFSAGLSVVFVPLGVLASSFGAIITRGLEFWLNLAGGIIILFMGLWTLRLFRLPLRVTKINKIQGGIFVFGLAYAMATVGRGAPMLISTLTLAALEGDPLLGGVAMIIYSFCLGLPLILFAILVETLKTEKKEAVQKWYVMLERATGVLLLSIGAYYLANAIMIPRTNV